MNYNTYRSEEEYEAAIEEERQRNPETLIDIVLPTKYMVVTTGFSQTRRDFELRHGVPQWKRYGVETLTLPFFPAGVALTSTEEIVTYRNKMSKMDSYILKGFDIQMIEDGNFRQRVSSSYDGMLRLRNFRDAYNYSLGKSVNLPHSNINIKADSNGIPQLHKWG